MTAFFKTEALEAIYKNKFNLHPSALLKGMKIWHIAETKCDVLHMSIGKAFGCRARQAIISVKVFLWYIDLSRGWTFQRLPCIGVVGPACGS